MTHPIINIEDLEYHPWGYGERFEARIGTIGGRVGAQKLGYNITVVAPGKRAFPFHSHRVNEEMFFIIEGAGEVRIGDRTYPIGRGDIIACPPGGPETAHQIINTSNTAELRYLAVSTRQSPEIAEYPDSGKYGVLAEFPGDEGGEPQVLRFINRGQASQDDYWDGE